jgi:hypothetical protein
VKRRAVVPIGVGRHGAGRDSSTRRRPLAASQAVANTRFMCVALKGSASYCSGTTVRLVLHPLCEPPHSGMVSKRLHGIITSCKVCVADRDVYVSVTSAAQGDRRARVTSLELLPTLPSSLHLPRARARQEMVAGESILSDESAAQLAGASCATLCVLITWSHSEIIRPVYANASASPPCSR